MAARRPGRVVIGADQVLECEGALFHKPADRAAARDAGCDDFVAKPLNAGRIFETAADSVSSAFFVM